MHDSPRYCALASYCIDCRNRGDRPKDIRPYLGRWNTKACMMYHKTMHHRSRNKRKLYRRSNSDFGGSPQSCQLDRWIDSAEVTYILHSSTKQVPTSNDLQIFSVLPIILWLALFASMKLHTFRLKTTRGASWLDLTLFTYIVGHLPIW